MTTSGTKDAEFLASLHQQAEESLAAGDVQGARQIWEAILQVDPEDARARAQVEKLASAAESAGPPSGADDLDLDLDLDVLETPTPTPTPGVPPSAVTQELERIPAIATDKGEVRDLVEAAADLVDEEPPEAIGAGEPLPTADPVLGEAALLVESAQRAFDKQDFDEAIALASRAMALSEQVPGAQELLAAARSRAAQRAAQGEQSLLAGIEAFEQGRPAEAIPLLEKALAMLPGHPEAEEYLAKARAAAEGATAAGGQEAATPPSQGEPSSEEEIDAIASIPLAEGHESAAGPSTGPRPAQPSHRIERVLPPKPKPEPVPLTVPSPLALGSPGTDAPRQAAAGAPAAARTPSKPLGKGFSAVSRRGGGLGRLLLAALVLSVAGVAIVAWKAPGLLVAGLDEPDDPLTAAARARLRAAREAKKKKAQPAAAAEAAPPEGAAAGKAPTASPGKKPPAAQPARRGAYGKEDVPRLVARADDLLAEGREREAIELLNAARAVAPSDFAVLDRLEAARRAVKDRQAAEERLQEGKEAFAQGSYEDALRDFYRVPENYRPPRLDRWIANGWYNLGVLALQRGDVVEAARHFRDALEVAPGDAGAQRNLEVTRRYRQRGDLDDAYRIYVAGLKLRSLDD